MKNEGFVTLFYKALTVIDAATLDPLQGLMGQYWYVDIALTGHTDQEGVIADFSKIKTKIKSIIDESVDHKLIVSENYVKTMEDFAKIDFFFGSSKVQKISYDAPIQAICAIPIGYDLNSLEAYIATIVQKQMPENIKRVEVTLREEFLSEMFHYTHGLKQHYGNCQRLFHGHKNTIEVWKNGLKDKELEKKLVHQIFKGNIHFAFWENVVNKEEILALHRFTKNEIPTGVLESDLSVELEYIASQGRYRASLPADQVFLMPCETTIENIASFFANYIKQNWASSSDKIMVVGFEGIAKGAKAIA